MKLLHSSFMILGSFLLWQSVSVGAVRGTAVVVEKKVRRPSVIFDVVQLLSALLWCHHTVLSWNTYSTHKLLVRLFIHSYPDLKVD